MVALVENVIGVLAVSTAISLAEGSAQYRRIPEMLKIGIVVSLTNASLALMGLTVLLANPGSAWLFVLPTITAALAYRAYISERQQHESIELLYESTRILQRSPQLDTAIISLLDHARKMFRADVAEIRLLPRHDGDEILRCQVGPGDEVVVMQPVGPALDDPILIRAVTERQGRLVDLPAAEGSDGATRRNGRKALVAPLLGESTLVGTLLVSDSLSDISTFEPEDLKLFETLANHTAIALENGRLEQSLEQLGRLKEELHHQASHDPLTGLANRSLFTQVVASRLESRDPNGTVPIVLFVDLDDFKLVNDSLGHAAGDALARRRRRSPRVGAARQRHGRPAGRRRVRRPPARHAGHEGVDARRQPADGGDGLVLRDRGPRRERPGQRRRGGRSAGRSRPPATCCATPTWRCTRPRRAARAASSSSSRRCTRR